MIAKTDMSSEAVTHRLKQMEGLWLLGTAIKKVKVVSEGAEKKNLKFKPRFETFCVLNGIRSRL